MASIVQTQWRGNRKMCCVIKREGLAAALDSLMDGYYRSYTLSPTRSCLSEINKVLYWRGVLPIFDVRAGPSLALHHHHHHPVKSYLFVKLELELLRPSPFGVPDGH